MPNKTENTNQNENQPLKKEPLFFMIIKTLLAVLLFAGIGTIIIGGGYIIGEYGKNRTSNKTVKPINQEENLSYYQELINGCEKFEKSKFVTDYDCCLQSVKTMDSGNFKLVPKSGCQKGFQVNSFWCGGSYSWCEQIEKNTRKNCNQDSDCVETQADCCNCNSGGEQIGINKKYLKVWENAWDKKCQNIGCIALFNCKDGKVVCENNQCKFKEGEINNGDQLNTSSWQTYRNEEFGFEVKYPEEYAIKDRKESYYKNSEIIFGFYMNQGSAVISNMDIVVYKRDNKEMLLEDYLKDSLGVENLQFFETINPNNIKAVKITNQKNEFGLATNILCRSYCFLNENYLFDFSFHQNWIDSEKSKSYYDIDAEHHTQLADDIFSTFKFIEN